MECFKKGLLSAVIASSFSGQALAEQSTDYFDMSIEQLLNVETTVASFRNEPANLSPSAVTVFTRQQLDSLAIDNLLQVMNFVPGFQATEGEFISSHLKLHSRGVYLDSGYVLIMINGIRLNEISFGKASVYTPNIDLSIAERVEVIRGPGSALYGSNAYLGVINVVTKSANEVAVQVGENNHQRLTASTSNKTAHGQLDINIAYSEGDGDIQRAPNDDENGGARFNKPYQHLMLTSRWQSGGGYLGYQFDQHDLNGNLNLEGYHADNGFSSQNQYFQAGYDKTVDNRFILSSELQYADHQIKSVGLIEKGSIAPFSHDFLNGPYWATNRKSADVNMKYLWSENAEYQFGFMWQQEMQYKTGVVTSHRSHDGTLTIPLDNYYLDGVKAFDHLEGFASLKQKVTSSALYFQSKLVFGQNNTLFVGGRYEDYETLGTAFSPRVSFVRQIDNQTHIKFNYSKALRVPTINELYSNDAVTKGNANLKPETISTFEAQYIYQEKNWSAEFTLFRNRMDDLIERKANMRMSESSFINVPGRDLTGLESLLNLKLSTNQQLRFTYSHYFDDTFGNSFDHFASVSYTAKMNRWRIGLNGVFRPQVEINNVNDNDLYKQDAVSLIGVNIDYLLGRHIRLNLAANNVFNEQHTSYEPRQDLNGYAVNQSQSDVRLSIAYKF